MATDSALGELIQALGLLSSFITTVFATSLIAFKIIRVTRQSHRQHHYRRVIEILVQSAAIVSIVMLGLVILSLMAFVSPFDVSTASGRFCYQLYTYLVFAQNPILVSNLSLSGYGFPF